MFDIVSGYICQWYQILTSKKWCFVTRTQWIKKKKILLCSCHILSQIGRNPLIYKGNFSGHNVFHCVIFSRNYLNIYVTQPSHNVLEMWLGFKFFSEKIQQFTRTPTVTGFNFFPERIFFVTPKSHEREFSTNFSHIYREISKDLPIFFSVFLTSFSKTVIIYSWTVLNPFMFPSTLIFCHKPSSISFIV